MKFKLTHGQSELIFHIIFWIAFLMVSSTITMEMFGSEMIVWRVGWVAFTFAAVVYLNFYWLIPSFLFSKRLVTYLVLVSSLVAAITTLRVELDAFHLEANQHMPVPLRSLSHYTFVAITYILVLFVTSSFRFLRYTYEKMKLEQELKAIRLEADLKFLKAQVNPHFLFNTLNNIYSLSMAGSPNAPDMIMKLSNMMRYLIYESDQVKVPLTREIDYLKNYIELQQMRTRERQNITLQVIGEPSGVMVEPMFFMPLLENSFKHGNPTDTASGWVQSEFRITDADITFSVSNTTSLTSTRKDKQGGIGLENIRSRLALVYPDKHEFSYSEENGIFTSLIRITIQ